MVTVIGPGGLTLLMLVPTDAWVMTGICPDLTLADPMIQLPTLCGALNCITSV